LKAENILIEKNVVKIADYGFFPELWREKCDSKTRFSIESKAPE